MYMNHYSCFQLVVLSEYHVTQLSQVNCRESRHPDWSNISHVTLSDIENVYRPRVSNVLFASLKLLNWHNIKAQILLHV